MSDPRARRVRVLILGGGIHGVGMLHELAARGWRDILLLEKDYIGAGTSSKSTKLIHGGLRYLQKISQFGMVRQSLKERGFLVENLPEVVKPLEILLPVLKGKSLGSPTIKIGLLLYDFLAGRQSIGKHQTVGLSDLGNAIPPINPSLFSKCYSYWDAQTDDLLLCNVIAQSARNLGATVLEHTEAQGIRKTADGWEVTFTNAAGHKEIVSALYVINCLGPWANRFLKKSGLVPTHEAFNNKGSHLVFEDLGLTKGLILPSSRQDRIFFLLPWEGKTLLGTTEEEFSEDPSNVTTSNEETDYLLANINNYLRKPLSEEDILYKFSGLRWLAVDKNESISSTSRESIIGVMRSGRGSMYTIYGGKLTSYRSLCSSVADQVFSPFDEESDGSTLDRDKWVYDLKTIKKQMPDLDRRFSDK